GRGGRRVGEKGPGPAGWGAPGKDPAPPLGVGPERVLVHGGHVVRDDVEQHAEPCRAEVAERPLPAERRRDAGRVGDVIAVCRPRRGLERGREVQVADAELAQVRDELAGGVESEGGPELEPVGAAPLVVHRRRRTTVERASRGTSPRAGNTSPTAPSSACAVDSSSVQRRPKRGGGSVNTTGSWK